jgi:putative transposase
MPRSIPIETGGEIVSRAPGSDPRKVALARLLWERTTGGQSWIAERFRMGTGANVRQQIGRAKSQKKRAKLPKGFRAYLKAVKI